MQIVGIYLKLGYFMLLNSFYFGFTHEWDFQFRLYECYLKLEVLSLSFFVLGRIKLLTYDLNGEGLVDISDFCLSSLDIKLDLYSFVGLKLNLYEVLSDKLVLCVVKSEFERWVNQLDHWRCSLQVCHLNTVWNRLILQQAVRYFLFWNIYCLKPGLFDRIKGSWLVLFAVQSALLLLNIWQMLIYHIKEWVFTRDLLWLGFFIVRLRFAMLRMILIQLIYDSLRYFRDFVSVYFDRIGVFILNEWCKIIVIMVKLVLFVTALTLLIRTRVHVICRWLFRRIFVYLFH